MAQTENTLLLGLAAPLYGGPDGGLLIEGQTLSGLHAWRENFDRVTAFAICKDEVASSGWMPLDHAELVTGGIDVVALPDTYARSFGKAQCQAVVDQLLNLMHKTTYHVFSYGGWLGDPGEIAASTARRYRICHGVWLDRVESQVVRRSAGNRLRDQAKSAVKSAIIKHNEKRAVRNADLSLLHGATVFNHFKTVARNPHQVEDVHFTQGDRVDDEFLTRKIASARQGPLHIIYCGRASRMKGPIDWLQVLASLKARGVAFKARWVGDGEMLTEMQGWASTNGLTHDDLVFEGFVADQESVRRFYRSAHLHLFCHQTDESPRNLIESLHSGTPLIGYGDPFSAELIHEKGGGMLVSRGKVDALVEAVSTLDSDRDRLADLIARAGASAAHLTRDRVFHHRSEIIRNQMPPMRHTA